MKDEERWRGEKEREGGRDRANWYLRFYSREERTRCASERVRGEGSCHQLLPPARGRPV